MSDRMSPEEMREFAVHVANLVDAKVEAKIDAAFTDLRAMLATAGDAGHAAVTRAAKVERKVDNHERRLQRLEEAHGLDSPSFEDDFPLRSAGE